MPLMRVPVSTLPALLGRLDPDERVRGRQCRAVCLTAVSAWGVQRR